MQYQLCCADLTQDQVPALRAMTEAAVQVTYQTMRKHCPDLLQWAAGQGYDRYLPLSKDWHVAYFRSTFEGKPCYYLVWSAFECIWT